MASYWTLLTVSSSHLRRVKSKGTLPIEKALPSKSQWKARACQTNGSQLHQKLHRHGLEVIYLGNHGTFSRSVNFLHASGPSRVDQDQDQPNRPGSLLWTNLTHLAYY